MPELPEVEVLSNAFNKLAKGKHIKDIVIHRTDLRVPLPKKMVQSFLVGKKIESVYRKAKYMIVDVGDHVGIMHFGMSGNLFHESSVKPVWPHTHVVFKVADKSSASDASFFHFADPRRFGLFTVCTKSELDDHKFFSHLGPDPLLHNKLATYLYDKSRKRVSPIKSFLMDSKVLVGVGNIYANESLHRSGIHPLKEAGKISKESFQTLSREIKKVLKEAIKKGGTSIKDYKGANGDAGYFSLSLKVYGKSGSPCSGCGKSIQLVKLAGRATYYCDLCQK